MARPRPANVAIRSRGYLPHWEAPNATYAVSFRLADSLPQHILEAYRREREDMVRTADAMKRPLSQWEQARIEELYSEKIEAYLDAGYGECHLRKPGIAVEAEPPFSIFTSSVTRCVPGASCPTMCTRC
ncbi:MAG TPA: hypothetical protein VHQ47_10395 [Phycisphaerae bacterium]|nr:hypothetical protein [Phycisphaerae bacterium]